MATWEIVLAIVMLSVIVAVMLRLSSPRAKPTYQTDSQRPTNPYHCVSIRYRRDACEAAKKLTGKHFRSKDAAPLPLPECTAENCGCRYAHHEDRRLEDRRSGLWSPFARQGSDRRLGRGRRWPDKFP